MVGLVLRMDSLFLLALLAASVAGSSIHKVKMLFSIFGALLVLFCSISGGVLVHRWWFSGAGLLVILGRASAI